MRRLPPIVQAMRPRQWLKNVLVVAGPFAAGTILHASIALAVLVAFIAFCLTSSGVYLINDVLDREVDRQHPVKRNRPIASGAVPVGVAVGVGLVLLVVPGVAVALLGYGELAIILAVYVALQLSYCLWLKHQAVIDLAIVSSGFLLRAMAGGVAAGVVLSPWFLIVASFGSLFMVAGKRYSEVHLVGEGQAATRPSLESYSASYLRFVWGIAGAVAVTAYSLWAFGLDRLHLLLPQLSTVPFVLALLRYAVDIDRGAAGEPESVVLGDRTLQVLGLMWLVVFGVSAVVG